MKKFKTCLYLRLSKEDDKNGESESISNQKLMLLNFLDNNQDLKLVSIKIDDGYSGSDFNRPAFKEMLQDIKDKKINCIVVKDFSRFGRDFIEVSRYLDEIFPFMDIRFISLNDNYDSLKNQNGLDNFIVPFKNLVNDSYLRDISLKIRSSLDTKRKKGDFTGAFATYGYLKDSNNKNKLIVDEIASQVVKDIFKYRLNGFSADKIAKILNENGILSPLEYKKSLGLKYNTDFKTNEKALWTAKAIFRILENPIYIGTLEQKKRTTPNYKIKKVIFVPKEEQIIVKNNHPPIIDEITFNNVQKIMLLDTRISPNNDKVYVLSGLLYCSKCGSSLIRKNKGTTKKPNFCYVCRTAKTSKNCTGVSINAQIIENIIFEAIKNQINNIVNIENILKTIDNLPYTLNQVKKVDKRLLGKKNELEKYQNIKLKLYEDLKDDTITKAEYKNFNSLYDKKIEDAKLVIAKLEIEIENLLKDNNYNQGFIKYFKQYEDIEKLTRELVVSLINKIIIGEIIDIYFNFEDEYKGILSYIQNIESLKVACNG